MNATARDGIRFRVVQTEAGWAAYVAGERGLRRAFLPEADEATVRARVAALAPEAVEAPRLRPELARQLREYFRGRDLALDAPIDWEGITPFRRRVYEALAATAPGETLSYGELARRAGSPGAARGVGSAMAANPFPPFVPCHRVVGSDGSLRGFSGPGGPLFKARLLELEGR
ncbi:MAG: methylated-DNA--[protein]-cysteine S-methyltransferase [Planctomycetota bacterium]